MMTEQLDETARGGRRQPVLMGCERREGEPEADLVDTYSVPSPCEAPPSSKLTLANVPKSSSSACSIGRPSASRSMFEVRPKRSWKPLLSA